MQHRCAPVFGDELDRIAHQVEQHLAQARRVRKNPVRQSRVNEQRDLHPLGARHVQHELGHAFHHLAQMGRDAFHFQFTGLDFGKIQDVIQDAEQGQRRVVNGVQHACLHRQESGLLQDIDHANHPVHGGANFMAHVGQKF